MFDVSATKPLSVRRLEQQKIAHEVFEFDTSIRSALDVAHVTGVSENEVYKTLVVEQDPPRGKPNLVLMPADSELDLKALAAALGVKKLRMASHADAERQTGLKVGGISPLALLGKGFPVYIDDRALALPRVLLSAGQRGMNVRLAVKDLLALTGARPVAGIGRPGSEG